VERQIAALLCRTSERGADAAAGTQELAQRLGARIIGSPGEPRAGDHRDDLRDARGCLLEAAGQIDDALDAGRIPILLAGECSVAVSTLPLVVSRRPGVRVLWLDAHPDFNTPDTSASGYLGGMCLAGACGLWDTGFGAGLDPARVIMFGVRDVDGPERVALDRTGVHRLGDPAQLEGMELFVHLDLDVLDPEFHPAGVPAPLGLSPAALLEVLSYVAAEATLVGAQITAAAPGYSQVAADAIAPLLA
jgi:arginase family enzyme